MAHLIDKDKVIAEIERLKKEEGWCQVGKDTADVYYARGFRFACERIINVLDTLEVKEVDTWHLQEKEDIYDAIKNWSLQTFVCIMKDGTIQKFIGNMDEDYEGHINVHIDGVNDDYDDVDDIVKWTVIKDM